MAGRHAFVQQKAGAAAGGSGGRMSGRLAPHNRPSVGPDVRQFWAIRYGTGGFIGDLWDQTVKDRPSYQGEPVHRLLFCRRSDGRAWLKSRPDRRGLHVVRVRVTVREVRAPAVRIR
jgi:hypothetical protein